MASKQTGHAGEFSRRQFLVGTGGALAGLGTLGLANLAAAAKRHPQRGGTLNYGASGDASGLDGHRHNTNHVSVPLSVMYTGLTDLDQQGNIVPGLAESWEPSKDLMSWVFRLRKGVLFHNGREVDAEAVKLNFERIKNPKTGGDWERGAIANVDRVEAIDRYTVRIYGVAPSVTMPANVMHYPVRMMAPDAFDQASDHPIGTGPFKFVSWTRYSETRMERFENYWETDAEGNNLPYLDAVVGKPKQEPSVRLTALRTGQVDFINTMAQADITPFQKDHGKDYQIWQWHAGGIFTVFNFRNGPFRDKRLRVAAAHAIDRNAIHHAVFYGHGAMADQPYPAGNPWHLEGITSLEYDPERAKAILKEARAEGTEVSLLCLATWVNGRETAQVVQDLWSAVGFKVEVNLLDTVPWRQARTKGTFTASIQGNTFRYDPDDFFGRNLYSKSQYAKVLSGWQNERYDQLIEEAKRTVDAGRRKTMYTEAWNIASAELPFFYLHELTETSAASEAVQGYQPGSAGALAYHGGGLRAAYMAT
jgi:peptide/nickel transport system substrate-binding protein